MKKVRIMLSAVAVLAIVGSALAFNAKSPSTLCVFQQNGTSTCPLVGTSDDAENIGTGTQYVTPKITTCPISVANSLCNEEVSFTLE